MEKHLGKPEVMDIQISEGYSLVIERPACIWVGRPPKGVTLVSLLEALSDFLGIPISEDVLADIRRYEDLKESFKKMGQEWVDARLWNQSVWRKDQSTLDTLALVSRVGDRVYLR
jgi:hypothetical protein